MPFCETTRTAAAPLARLTLGLLAAALGAAGFTAQASTYPITSEQRATADKVAQAGVPLSELAPNAPDTHVVKAGDTLWDISGLFLKSPWRWPELWGMNREQIANPHLIYPGQVLMLVKIDGRAYLQIAQGRDGSGAVKLSPRVRSSELDRLGIAAIPQHLIEPFLNEAVVFDTDVMATAPRIVATPENRVLVTHGDIAYARGDLSQATDYRVFRTAQPLRDPTTKEILGYEAPYMGSAELHKPAEDHKTADGKIEIVPATLKIKTVRQEIGVGDRLAPVPPRNFTRYLPHAPNGQIAGQIISIYGDALKAGRNQIVALNRGSRDGLERGHVLSLWQNGRRVIDRTSEKREEIKLPDEHQGMLFVFQVYTRVSYALIVSSKDPIEPGDRFSEP